MDLEHSFGPAYARGLLVRGQQCWALIGVNAEESQATIDGVLTLGILWLAYCREHVAGKRVCQGTQGSFACRLRRHHAGAYGLAQSRAGAVGALRVGHG